MHATVTIGEWAAAHPELLAPEPVITHAAGPPLWFVLETEPLRETLAAAHMIGRGIGCYLPSLSVFARRGRAMQWRTDPMFRGYLFVRTAAATAARDMAIAQGLPGVRAAVRRGDAGEAMPYAVIRPEDIDQMRGAEHRSHERKRAALRSGGLKPGDAVVVIDGPFEAQAGRIETLSADGRVGLLMEMLGRASRVVLPAAIVQPVG